MMKKPYLYLLAIACSLSACKKDKSTAAPVADFNFPYNKSNSIIINETTSIVLVNTSQNATSYLWDFGNGKTSTEAQPGLDLRSGGNYTISLTAKNNTGQSSTVKKQVKVVSPALKTITIKEMNWALGLTPGIPNFTKADVWVEITKSDSGKYYPRLANGAYDAPLFYKSKIYKNATINSAPFDISVDEKVLLNQNTIFDTFGHYSVNLYAKDATGTTYLLKTTDVSTGTGPYLGVLSQNSFNWNTGLFNGYEVDLSGDFE